MSRATEAALKAAVFRADRSALHVHRLVDSHASDKSSVVANARAELSAAVAAVAELVARAHGEGGAAFERHEKLVSRARAALAAAAAAAA